MKSMISAALLLTLGLTGCATILNDSTQPINVSTSSGAQISGTVDGIPFTAPGIVSVTRTDQDKVFVTDAAGCAKETIAPKTVDTVFFVNILSGGAFGSTTDYATDKMWQYSDNVVISCAK